MQKVLKSKVLLVFFLLPMVLPLTQVEASPFSGSKAGEPRETVSKPSITGIIWFKFLKTQKDLNRKITHYLNEIKKGEKPFLIWLVFGLAFLYGVLHSVGPGHGKLIMLSYFTASKANWPVAVLMGFSIAFMHSLSAIILVLSVNNIAKYILMSSQAQEILVLTLISYGAIVFVGIFLLWQTYKESKKQKLEDMNEEVKPGASRWVIALSIGMIPCSGALLILFYAMAKQMLFIGLISVFFMALGMAFTLSSIGSVYIIARQKISYFTVSEKRKNFALGIQYAGAALIVLIGSVLFIRALKIAF